MRSPILDWQEIVTFSFVDSGVEAAISPPTSPQGRPVRVLNPIAAQRDVMRTSLLPGLIETLQTNLNRKESRIRIFELGRTFHHAAAGYAQPHSAGRAGVWRRGTGTVGPAYPRHRLLRRQGRYRDTDLASPRHDRDDGAPGPASGTLRLHRHRRRRRGLVGRIASAPGPALRFAQGTCSLRTRCECADGAADACWKTGFPRPHRAP